MTRFQRAFAATSFAILGLLGYVTREWTPSGLAWLLVFISIMGLAGASIPISFTPESKSHTPQLGEGVDGVVLTDLGRKKRVEVIRLSVKISKGKIDPADFFRAGNPFPLVVVDGIDEFSAERLVSEFERLGAQAHRARS